MGKVNENETPYEKQLANDDMSSPLQLSFTKQELRSLTTKYMLKIYGSPKDMTEDDQDRWFTRSGILLGFVASLFDSDSGTG
jgi:hypothetical protein